MIGCVSVYKSEITNITVSKDHATTQRFSCCDVVSQLFLVTFDLRFSVVNYNLPERSYWWS